MDSSTTTGTSTGTSTGPAAEHGDERWHVEVSSPVGPLRVVAEGGMIVGLYHGDHSPAPSQGRLGRPATGPDTSPREEAPAPGRVVGPVTPDRTMAVLRRAAAELAEYFAGTRRAFEVPVGLQGTSFQVGVWEALTRIPYGQRRSYRDIAEELDNPRMGRAVGAAVRANPVSIIVPGHRVLSSAGAVLGYSAGTGIKTALLDLESGRQRGPESGRQ